MKCEASNNTEPCWGEVIIRDIIDFGDDDIPCYLCKGHEFYYSVDISPNLIIMLIKLKIHHQSQRLKLYQPPLIMLNLIITECCKIIKRGIYREGDYLKLISTGELVRVVNMVGTLIEVLCKSRYFYITERDVIWISHSKL